MSHQLSFHPQAGWKPAHAAAKCVLTGQQVITGLTSHLLAGCLAWPASYLLAGLTNDSRAVYSPQAIRGSCPLQECSISQIFIPLLNLFEQDSTIAWERWDGALRQGHTWRQITARCCDLQKPGQGQMMRISHEEYSRSKQPSFLLCLPWVWFWSLLSLEAWMIEKHTSNQQMILDSEGAERFEGQSVNATPCNEEQDWHISLVLQIRAKLTLGWTLNSICKIWKEKDALVFFSGDAFAEPIKPSRKLENTFLKGVSRWEKIWAREVFGRHVSWRKVVFLSNRNCLGKGNNKI